jgi:hypothetical protein
LNKVASAPEGHELQTLLSIADINPLPMACYLTLEMKIEILDNSTLPAVGGANTDAARPQYPPGVIVLQEPPTVVTPNVNLTGVLSSPNCDFTLDSMRHKTQCCMQWCGLLLLLLLLRWLLMRYGSLCTACLSLIISPSSNVCLVNVQAMEMEKYYAKAVNFVLLMSFVSLFQILLVISQITATNTPAVWIVAIQSQSHEPIELIHRWVVG